MGISWDTCIVHKSTPTFFGKRHSPFASEPMSFPSPGLRTEINYTPSLCERVQLKGASAGAETR